MADVGTALSRELSRIIACPYPPSLTKLAGLLARADSLTVRTCIHDRPPCAVAKLATIVSAALPLWAYTLGVLSALCHSPEFKNNLLTQTPGLLDALLTKANSSQHDFDEYAGLCVLLLSHPLPGAISLPASAQSFFLRVFDKAVKAPDVGTLKPIYCMLNGACGELLSLLPSEARHGFDKELCHILSSNSTGQNSMLLLWCFGIVILAEHAQDVGRIRSSLPSFQTRTPDVTPERQWKTASGRKLFGSKNGLYKTINLTYLSVIWASKGEVGVPDIEAIEGIRIATRTMAFVDQGTREGWPNSSLLAKNTFPKLPAKILRKGIHPGVQLEALCFYAMIAGENSLPMEIVAQYETTIANVTSLYTNTDSLREALSVSLPLFAPQLRESTVRGLLSEILRISTMSGSAHELCTFSILVEELAAVIPNCTLRSQILLALSSNELQESVLKFLQATPESCFKEDQARSCDTFTSLQHRVLVSTTVSMLLTSALTAQSAEPGLPPSLAISLISKQQHLTYVTSQCSRVVPSGHPSVSLFEQECTPSTGQHLQDWRDRLKSELESQSFYQRDSIIRSVAQICQELESRCETVEEPLRREQAKSKELAAQVSELREQVLSLESEAVDLRLYVDGLEAEIGTVENERDNISSRLEELRTEFTNANKNAKETLRVAQEEFNARELQFRSTILTHEEDVVARSKEVERLNEEIERLADKMQRKEGEKNSLDEVHETLKARYSDLEHELEAKRHTVSQQADEIARLGGENTDLERRLQNSETELGAVTGQMSELQVRYQELIRSSEEALQDLETKYESDTRAAAAKASEEYNQLNDELQDALHNGRQANDAYEDTRRDLHLLQTTANTFEAKIQQLTDTCLEKDEELHELRSLRSRVLQSMGLAADNPLPIRTGHASNPMTPRQHRRRKSAIQTQDIPPKATNSTQGITNTAIENVANASFTSSDSSRSGSTPKRAKPRPSFKIPTMHTPYIRKPGNSSQSFAKKSSPAKRSVLRPVSPNRRHTTVGFAILEGENEENEDECKDGFVLGKRSGSLGGIGQASFDMDGYLASTPFTPGNFVCGTGRGPEQDEGTTEL